MKMKKARNKPPNLKAVKMLVLDVDGVLTDGAIVVDSNGKESKFFNVADGHGIKMWKRSGLKVAFLSGRKSEPTNQQARELAIDFCLQDCRDKLLCLRKLTQKSGISANNIAYVGDDLPDLPVIRQVAFSAAPADAITEVKKKVAYVASKKGGHGAVREIIEYILKKTGKWEELLERYLKEQ